MCSVFTVKSFKTSLVFERFIAVKISTKIVKGKTTLMVCAPKGVTNKVPFKWRFLWFSWSTGSSQKFLHIIHPHLLGCQQPFICLISWILLGSSGQGPHLIQQCLLLYLGFCWSVHIVKDFVFVSELLFAADWYWSAHCGQFKTQ